MNQQFTKLMLLVATLAMSNLASAATYYVGPGGSDTNAGSLASPWRTFQKAQSAAAAGDTIYFRGGTYLITAGENSCASTTDTVNAINVNKSGTASSPILYAAYGNEVPIFDFSMMQDNCRVKGFNITASYLHFLGLEVTGAPQHAGNFDNHESWGMWVNGSYNTFERLNLHHNMGPGLFLLSGSYNLFLNSDSHDNYDPNSSSGAGTNADGFGMHMRTDGAYPGNVIRGCRAWNNSDDGYDILHAETSVTIENSWSWHNGYIPGTETSAGDGNGFKAGGYGGAYDANAPIHIVRNNVAFNNKAAGFYANHHPAASQFYNNTAINNHSDFNMLGVDSKGKAVGRGWLRNNIAYLGTLTTNMTGTDAAYNTWNLPVTVSNADFQSVTLTGWDAARQADGSLPVLPHYHLASGSDLIDVGTNVGLPYNGAAPDLGAFEY
jgi:hypothetical protein